jgi:diadenosine tetraphosphate (Ap4A) HIT family hydrolase
MSHQENCEFCDKKFSETALKEYTDWEVQLFLNQYHLGRSLIKLKRHAVDLTELKEDERKELFEKVLPELEDTLNKLFQPDLYNQATLGNDCRHLHIHVIPRYSSERTFNGQTFRDENWNEDYRPHPDTIDIPDATFEKMEEKIASELEQ